MIGGIGAAMDPHMFPLIQDLAITNVDMWYILAAAFMPSIAGLLLALIALWLPDEDYVLSQAHDDRPKRIPVATDGEVTVLSTPLHYRIRPGALKVIVPKEVVGDG